MRENKKYKQVKVRCFKTGQNLYSEIFQNITEKQLEKELNKMARAGWDRFDIDTDGKKRTLVLKKRHKSSQQGESALVKKTPVDSTGTGRKTPKFTGSEGNSAEETTAPGPISKELAGAKDWKPLAIEAREKKKKRKK